MLPFDEIARANPDYVDTLYRDYLRDPAAVDERWALVFAGFDLALRDGARAGGSIAELVHTYRELGHLVTDLDPLGGSPREHPLLRLTELGFTERDLDRVVDWAPFKGGERGTLGELIGALRETYCGTLGVEYLSVADKARRDWLQERMEPRRNRPELSAEDRRAVLERLVTAEAFEHMIGLATRYTDGVQEVLDRSGMPWSVVQLGARAEYRFCRPAPVNGGQSAAAADDQLDDYLHVYLHNRCILLTPFHNMALMCPATTEADVDRHTEVFGAAVAELVGDRG